MVCFNSYRILLMTTKYDDVYQKSIQSYQNELRLKCREQKIDYVPLFTYQRLDLALNEYLKKRQRLG